MQLQSTNGWTITNPDPSQFLAVKGKSTITITYKLLTEAVETKGKAVNGFGWYVIHLDHKPMHFARGVKQAAQKITLLMQSK